ncbi:hypothetical protein [Pseudoalteromonas sp. SG45-2]|uniref:hypothetical protein n=1 Tax=Pseudoalteromonas sp. SG45-2 TaxID=2760956 RepID=UPI00160374EB|nr:hypothetical protein [Pseudoalteromonas sp. SG45-2]MBB1347222.1 hypothetical protein [Pseudoalteromonas sp. SG45-2]
MTYVKMEITPEIFETAIARAVNLSPYQLNFKQHLQDKDGEIQAKLEGTIGEVVVEAWLKSNNIWFEDNRSNHTHDYSLHNDTLEVKTKVRKVPPSLGYECSIPEYTMDMQTAKIYTFVSLTQVEDKQLSLAKYPEAYIVGVISKERFRSIARHFKKGDFDPSNNFTFKKSCFNVFINQMTSPVEFPEIYKNYISAKIN